MAKIIDIGTVFSRIYRDIDSQTNEPDAPKHPNKIIPSLLILCLIGTMLPFQIAMTFFSLSCVTIALLYLLLLWKKQLTITGKTAAIIVALTATSILTGCSPALTFNTEPELIKFAQANDFSYHRMQRIGVFGLGLTDATIETAQIESGLKIISGAQVDKGYGLISVVSITVAGKS